MSDPIVQSNRNYFEGKTGAGMNLTDDILTNKEIQSLNNVIKNRSPETKKLSRIACLESLKGIEGENFLDKLAKFKSAPGNLRDKYNSQSLNNEDIAVFQFIYNLQNPTKKIDIDGQLGHKTYTALMGYQYGEKYDRNATLSVLQKKFPTLDKSLMNARATAITQRENPFQHGGKSYYWRYDTIMSITPNKEKYEKTQDTKDMKEYKEKIAPTIQSIEVSKNMAKDGNIEGLEYDFKSAEFAKECDMIINKKLISILQICKDKKISSAGDSPFSKIYIRSGHFEFKGYNSDGSKYKISPLFSPSDLGGSDSELYNIMDKNEDAFLAYLNTRWKELYTTQVIETQKNAFIDGLDINRGSNKEKVQTYLQNTLKKAEDHNKKYPANDAEPFKNDNSFADQEIYFKGRQEQQREGDEMGVYTVYIKKELGCFDKKTKEALGVTTIMSDDDNVKKVVKRLNDQWMKTHIQKEITNQDAEKIINKAALQEKLQNDITLTPQELQALQQYEKSAFDATKKPGTTTKQLEEYLMLYTHDKALVPGIGEKILIHAQTQVDRLLKTNPMIAYNVFQHLHKQYDAEGHPDSAMAILKQFTGYFGQKLYQSFSEKITQDPQNKETYQKQLLNLAKLVTDRNGDIDTDLKDIPLAKQIMNDLMPSVIDKGAVNKARDDQCEKKFNTNRAKIQKIFGTNPQLQALLGKNTTFSRNNKRTFEQKQYVNTLTEYVIRFGDPATDPEMKNKSPQAQAQLIAERTMAITQKSTQSLMKSFTDFADQGGKYSDDFKLNGIQKEIYDMYRDMMGIGKFNLSDENWDKTVEYSKMVGVIAVAIAATIVVSIVTGGTGTAGAVTLSRSAVSSVAASGILAAGAGSLAGYLADYVINQRQAESDALFIKDMFSTLAVDVATGGPFALIPGLGPIVSKFPKLGQLFVTVGTKVGNKAITGAEMLTSGVISGYAEQWRQQYIMGQEVSTDQLIQQIGMGLALPAVLQGGPKLITGLKTVDYQKLKQSGEQSKKLAQETLQKPGIGTEEKKTLQALVKSYEEDLQMLEHMRHNKSGLETKQSPNEKITHEKMSKQAQVIIESHPELLKGIINPQALEAILQDELFGGNITLKPDGSIQSILVEVNGEKKPSQLFAKMKADGFSEQQALKTWLQVRTPEFTNRFGDRTSADKTQVSKVVDENGEPLMVYHLSSKQFNYFDIKKSKNNAFGKGFYFTPDTHNIILQFHLTEDASVQYAMFLNVRNPYKGFDQVNGFNLYSTEINEYIVSKIIQQGDTGSQDYIIAKNIKEGGDYSLEKCLSLLIRIKNDSYYDEFLKGNGFDGVIATKGQRNEIVVFHDTDIKSINNDGSFSPETAKFNDYFGKSSRFGFDSKQARENSRWMDSTTDLQQIRDRIKTQYETMTGQKLDLTDAQIQTIIGTHLLPGELGKLIPAELKAKVKLLTTTIPDEGVRRFLLEGGFCGKWDIPSMIKNMHYKTKINDDFEYNYFKNQLEKYKGMGFLEIKDAIFNKENYDFFKFKDIFDLPTGVDDPGHEILRGHTELVMKEFGKSFNRLPRSYIDLIGKILLIHDIPKAIAIKMGLSKDKQHNIAKIIVSDLLNAIGITGKEEKIAKFLLTNDSIGKHAQGKMDQEEFLAYQKEIAQLSKEIGIPVQEIYGLQLSYYYYDAGSYNDLKSIFGTRNNSDELFINGTNATFFEEFFETFTDYKNSENHHIREKVNALVPNRNKISREYIQYINSLNDHQKKYIFKKILSGGVRLESFSGPQTTFFSDKDYYQWALNLYSQDHYKGYNHISRGKITKLIENPDVNDPKVSVLGEYFLRKGFKENRFEKYNQKKLLYRGFNTEDENLIQYIVNLKRGDTYKDDGYFSTTRDVRESLGSYFKNNLPQTDGHTNKSDKQHEIILDLDIDYNEVSQNINDQYSVQIVITNSHSGVDVQKYSTSDHSAKEKEILFPPQTPRKILKNKVDHVKKKILLIVEEK